MPFFHGDRQKTHRLALGCTNRGVAPLRLDLLAQICGRRSTGALERHIGGLDACHLVETDLGKMIGGRLARTRHGQRAWIGLGVGDEIIQCLVGAIGGDHDRVGGVMEHVERVDVIGGEADILLRRLDNDMRQVDAHDGVTIAGHRIELRPADRTTAAGLVRDHQILTELFLEKGLLEAG